MANYTPWDINDYLPGQPLTSAKAISFHENLDAVAEGAPDAPRNAARANAFSTYMVYKRRSGNASEISAWTGLDTLAIAQVITSWFASNDDSGFDIDVTTRIRGSADGGVTWGAWQTLDDNSITRGNTDNKMYYIVVNLSTGTVRVSGPVNVMANLGVTSVNALEVNNLSSGVGSGDTFIQSAHGFLHCRAEDS